MLVTPSDLGVTAPDSVYLQLLSRFPRVTTQRSLGTVMCCGVRQLSTRHTYKYTADSTMRWLRSKPTRVWTRVSPAVELGGEGGVGRLMDIGLCRLKWNHFPQNPNWTKVSTWSLRSQIDLLFRLSILATCRRSDIKNCKCKYRELNGIFVKR